MDRNEKSRHQACSAPTSGAEETPAGDSELAQNIWGRYGHSPGVIPTAVTLGLARRITRLSTNRIPLLADIQRRWTADDVSFPGGWSSLPYARPIVFPDTLSVSANTTAPAPAARVRNFGHAGPVSLSGHLAGSQSIVSALPTKEQNSVNRPVVEKVKRLSIHSSTSQGEEAPKLQASATEVQDAPNRGVLEKGPMAGMENHSTEAKNSTCPVTGQNIVSALPTKEQNSVNRPVVEKIKRLSIHPSTSQGKEALKLQASATEVQDAPNRGVPEKGPMVGMENHSTEAKNSTCPVTGQNIVSALPTKEQNSVNRPVVEKVKRLSIHSSTSQGKEALKLQASATEVQDAPNRGVPEKGPMAGIENYSTEAKNSTCPVTGQNAEPSTFLSKDTLKLKPAVQKTQHGSDVVEIRTGVSIMTSANNLGTAITQRFMDGPAGRVARRTSEFFGRYPDGQAGPQRTSGMTDQGRSESHRTFNILQHVEKIGIPLSMSALTGTSAFINARPLMGPSSDRPPEMPFVKADGLNSRKIEPQSNSFSSPIAMPLQRGVADASSNILANEVLSTVSTQDVNEPSSLSMVESDTETLDLERLDLERLANEVYAIIEQRITIERENFGI